MIVSVGTGAGGCRGGSPPNNHEKKGAMLSSARSYTRNHDLLGAQWMMRGVRTLENFHGFMMY